MKLPPFALSLLVLSSSTPGGQAQFTDIQCLAALPLLDIDYSEIASYSIVYNEDSVYSLRETGQYKGPDDIAEYVQFRALSSPYIDQVQDGLGGKNEFLGVDPVTGICELRSASVLRNWLSPANAINASYTTSFLLKFQYNITSGFANRANLYFTPEFISFFFGESLQTRNSMRTVCEIIENKCPDIHAANGNLTTAACIDRMFALPSLSPGNRADGLDRGCRVLHSTFVNVNPTDHCAHLAFEPIPDPKGRIKCQESAEIEVEDLFEQADLDWYVDFLNEMDLPETGFVVHFAEFPDTDPTSAPEGETRTTAATAAPGTQSPDSSAHCAAFGVLTTASLLVASMIASTFF
jgi:hypothetical protein